ncbi:hypothetical protein 274BB002_62 [Bacillus phage 274BB002]|nr:hypothetical protein 274BB002_62 [Bacillus phage 274BB002]
MADTIELWISNTTLTVTCLSCIMVNLLSLTLIFMYNQRLDVLGSGYPRAFFLCFSFSEKYS